MNQRRLLTTPTRTTAPDLTHGAPQQEFLGAAQLSRGNQRQQHAFQQQQRAFHSQQTPVHQADPGKTGGKVTHQDFAQAEGMTPLDVATAGYDVRLMNAADMTAAVARAKDLGPRSTREMLGAIASKQLPRFVARVGAKAAFDGGCFGNPHANQIFATEPSDVAGLSAAEALIKVGWTPEQLEGQVGKEIGLCIFDTQQVVAAKSDPQKTVTPGVQEMNWDTLEAMAADDKKNAWFHSQLSKVSGPAGHKVSAADLPTMFALAKKTPMGAKPDVADPVLADKYIAFREALGSGMSASNLFSGMGATLSESGQLGAREVMVTNEDSGFKLTSENSQVISLGVLTREDLDLLRGIKPPLREEE